MIEQMEIVLVDIFELGAEAGAGFVTVLQGCVKVGGRLRFVGG